MYLVSGCLGLDAESVDDLKRLLREIGYSVQAIEEILKWYDDRNSSKRAG